VLQPRLDWQMWFAALGRYEHNAWLVHFALKVLKRNPEVLRLVAPLPVANPKFLKMTLYHYDFDERVHGSNWWKREAVREYFPTITVDSLRDVVAQFPNWVPVDIREDAPVPPPREGSFARAVWSLGTFVRDHHEAAFRTAQAFSLIAIASMILAPALQRGRKGGAGAAELKVKRD
jgi:hypothetical protein